MNQLKPNTNNLKFEIVQQQLQNIIDITEEKNNVLIKQAEELGYDRKVIEEMIDSRKVNDWSVDALT